MATSAKFKLVAVGGTFDAFHIGHEALLSEAFRTGQKVLIGLSNDTFASKLLKEHSIDPYVKRARILTQFLSAKNLSSRAEIIPLSDPFGPAVSNPHIEAIVVSTLTAPTAKLINRKRSEARLSPLVIVAIPLVTGYDGQPIHSTRIRRGEIDRFGRPRL